MSADNYYVVKRHPNAGFTYVMGFASVNEPARKARLFDPQFDTLEDAVKAAARENAEYGYSIDDECWTILPTCKET